MEGGGDCTYFKSLFFFSAKDSPALSHHCALNFQDRYVLLIGGWNGKVRSSDVFAYDTTENRWLQPCTQGFPHGAGLSSHACVLLSNGDILAIGREGGLRTQRRSGNAFLLKGNVQSGFTYSPHAIGVSSRSGHTAHLLGSNLVVYGGRGDKAIEIHGGFKGATKLTSEAVDKLQAYVKNSSLAPMSKPPCGRKHHIAVASGSHGGALLIHGGETFDGKSREPVGELYLLTFKPTMTWYKLGITDFGRTGHVCGSHAGSLVIHGGEGAKGVVSTQTFKISLA